MRTIITALLVLMLCSPSVLWAEGFGSEATGNVSQEIENIYQSGVFTCPTAGGGDSIKAEILCSTANKKFKFALYEWAESGDLVLIDTTDEETAIAGTTQWYTLTLQNFRSLSASTNYSLTVWGEMGDGDLKLRQEFGSGYWRWWRNSRTYNGWDDPVTPSGRLEDQGPMSIYCFYTEGARFGTDVEGPLQTSIGDVIWGNIASPASSGTLDGVRVYLTVTTASHNVKCALYLWSDTSLVDSTYIVDVPITESWVVFDFVNNASITASTEYAIVVIAEANGGDCKIDFATSGGSHVGESGGSYGVWPSDWTTVNQSGSFDFSIYAFYTPADGEAVGKIIFIR